MGLASLLDEVKGLVRAYIEAGREASSPRWVPIGIALLALAGIHGGCARQSSFSGWNVVLIVVDSLRAQNLGAYGYPRPTSAFIDSLAEEGVVFERAASPSSYTRESVAGLFVGMLPSASGATGWAAQPPPDGVTLASALRAKGYRTAMVSNSRTLRAGGFVKGFEKTRFPARGQRLSGGAPGAAAIAGRIIQEWKSDPFFLYLHLLDPHGPYEPPDHLRETMDAEAPDRPLALYGEVRDRVSELRAEGFGPGETRFEDLLARYDAEIAHVDGALKAFFDRLEDAGVAERTLVILTSDHGEEFLEHDFVEHAWTVYEESLHVPLILWAPARLDPERVAQRVSTLDLLPTLGVLFELPLPMQELDGVPLLEPSASGWAVRPRPEPVYSELMIETRNLVRSVVEDDWKYVAVWRWMTPAQREREVRRDRVNQMPPGFQPTDPFGPVVREELYHLGRDPGESRDLSAEEPVRLHAMRERMLGWLEKRTPAASGGKVAPAPELSPEEQEALRALGYL